MKAPSAERRSTGHGTVTVEAEALSIPPSARSVAAPATATRSAADLFSSGSARAVSVKARPASSGARPMMDRPYVPMCMTMSPVAATGAPRRRCKRPSSTTRHAAPRGGVVTLP